MAFWILQVSKYEPFSIIIIDSASLAGQFNPYIQGDQWTRGSNEDVSYVSSLDRGIERLCQWCRAVGVFVVILSNIAWRESRG